MQKKIENLVKKSFAEVSKGLKCIFERTWSQIKAEKYSKEKKNAKQKVNKFRKKRNTAEKFENLAENYLLKGAGAGAV